MKASRSVERVIVRADGGSRGNPGPAGYGAVVLDAAGVDVLAERYGWLGTTTNNVAEYTGLLAGLEAAAELGATDVHVQMDSKLVVEQMSGRWQIKNPQLRSLASRARELARDFDQVSFEWIPRAANAHADRLANEAMDTRTDGRRGADETPTAAAGPEAASFEPEVSDVDSADSSTPASASWTGVAGEPTRLLLVRHGQTELSVQRRYSGRTDPPLTETGVAQAKAVAARLSTVDTIAEVISSPLARASGTARQIAQQTHRALTIEPALTETDFGEWDGLTFAEAAARDERLHRGWLGDPSVPAPGGESFDQVHERVAVAVERLVAAHPATTLVVVSHVTPIKSILRMGLAAGPSVLYRLHLDLASLSIVDFYPDGNASVRLINDTSHL